ncbi:MAG: hypothetical protein JNK38_09110 [Acidobacteria bacterium]|nr:hypothetical protein [Acidobacteriota bacterium]
MSIVLKVRRFVFVILAGLALIPFAVPVLYAERLPVKLYTTADGLPSTQIKRIVRDSHGFLWFCTRNGLSRFDGAEFVNYNIIDGLPDPTINDLLESRSGVYWVATNGGGVSRFDPRVSTATQSALRFKHYAVGIHIASNRVNRLCEDLLGRIWAATDRGIFRLEAKHDASFQQVDLPVTPRAPGEESANAIMADRSGTVWVGFSSAGLFRVWPDGRIEQFAQRAKLPITPINSLLEDRTGRIWVGTWGHGLFRIEDGTGSNQPLAAQQFTTKDALPADSVHSMYQFPDGRLWAFTEMGIAEFDGNAFKPLDQINRLIGGVVEMAMEDRDGNLWLSSLHLGVTKLIRQGFTTWDQNDAPGLRFPYPLYTDANGEIIANGMKNWTINQFDGQRFTTVRPLLPPDPGNLWLNTGAYRDRFGEWWVTSRTGLYRFPQVRRLADLAHTSPKAVYRLGSGLSHDIVYRVYEDVRGDLWVGGLNENANNLTRWERASETFHPVKIPPEISDPQVPSVFLEDRAGNLWIAFQDGGLVRYRDGRFIVMQQADGWPHSQIMSGYLDQSGRLWLVGGAAGLMRIDDPAAESPRPTRIYTMADGLSSGNVRAVTGDQWGRIYIGTAAGIDRLDLAYNSVRHYTAADGLSNEFVVSAQRDRNGHLWFGTIEGLSRLVPEPDVPSVPPPVKIGALHVAGVPYGVSEIGEEAVGTLKLDAAQNNVQIDYFGVSFAFGERLRFQYKLENADREWSAPTEQRSVNYANLAPGSYRFLVRAINADGVVSAQPATVAFMILPPLWRRWWFMVLIVLSVGAAIYALYRYRVSHLLALERVRMRIAHDLHDDIGSNLSRIAMLSEVARQHLGGDDSEVTDRLTRVAAISRESVDALGDIVWAINPARDRLSDLTQRMRRVADDFCSARDIAFDIHTAIADHNARLDSDTRREVLLIFKECLNNIARHSGCTAVNAEFRQQDGWLVLQIGDNGKGIEPSRQNNGHGLNSMQQRAVRLGGELAITSDNSIGTTLRLTVPLSRRKRRF